MTQIRQGAEKWRAVAQDGSRWRRWARQCEAAENLTRRHHRIIAYRLLLHSDDLSLDQSGSFFFSSSSSSPFKNAESRLSAAWKLISAGGWMVRKGAAAATDALVRSQNQQKRIWLCAAILTPIINSNAVYHRGARAEEGTAKPRV